MNRIQSRFAAKAHFMESATLMEVYKLMDKDGSGHINAGEVQEMFNTICGTEVEATGFQESFSLSEFRDLVELVSRTYPQYNVAGNLVQYLKDNRTEEPDPDELCMENCEKLFTILDNDGAGELDVMEVWRMFKFLGMDAASLIEAFEERGSIGSAEDFQSLLKEMNEKFPGKNIPDRVVEFLGDAAAAGGKPDTSEADGKPDPPEPEEAGGTRKALLVGINYIGKNGELGGCINDVRNQMAVLMEQFGFQEENILLLTEDQDDDEKLPTGANMRRGFEWLFDGVSAGDELFFQYSGHGSQCADRTGDESDGKNECLCPLDCQDGPWPEYVILDNEINTTFHENLPEGVKCICVFDCCHSATVADLQCTRAFSFEPEEADSSRFLQPSEEEQEALDNAPAGPRQVASRGDSEPDKQLWTFSGCQDNQTSADATIDGLRQGALTWGLIKALKENGFSARYEDLLAATRANLKDRFTQVPALSTTSEDNFQRYYMSPQA